MSNSITVPQSLEVVECPTCRLPFAFPATLANERRQTHEKIHCPSGHVMNFKSTSTLDRTLNDFAAAIDAHRDEVKKLKSAHVAELAAVRDKFDILNERFDEARSDWEKRREEHQSEIAELSRQLADAQAETRDDRKAVKKSAAKLRAQKPAAAKAPARSRKR